MRTWLTLIATVAVIAAIGWASDTVTLQGERTIYTVQCGQGTWQGQRCSGQLVAADRFRFRALKAHREVLFWRVGVAETSRKLTDCLIEDGRNWNCKPTVDASRTITLNVIHGQPVPDASGSTLPLHAIAKWRWWLLRWGILVGNEANG